MVTSPSFLRASAEPLIAAAWGQSITRHWRGLGEDAQLLVKVALVIVAGALLQLLVKRTLRVLTENGHLPGTMALRLRSFFRLLMIAIVAAAVLQLSHVFDQAWAVLSGVLLAMAVGFVALWSVLSNVVCALMILIFRPFRLGDHVEVLEPADNKDKRGFEGTVIDLSLMFTTIRAEDTDDEIVLLRVPNSIFFLKGLRVTFPASRADSTTFLPPESRHTHE